MVAHMVRQDVFCSLQVINGNLKRIQNSPELTNVSSGINLITASYEIIVFRELSLYYKRYSTNILTKLNSSFEIISKEEFLKLF